MAISDLIQFSHTYDPSLGAQLGRVGVAGLFGGQGNHTISAKYQLENRRCQRQQKACNDAPPTLRLQPLGQSESGALARPIRRSIGLVASKQTKAKSS